MRRITTRFGLLIATAAFLPLAIYGLVSVASLQAGTERSVTLGNHAVADQVAERIALYFDHNVRVLRSVGAELHDTQLLLWQRDRILRNHVLDFREFREISVFDTVGRPVASSRLRGSTLTLPDGIQMPQDGYYVAPPHLDADLLPTTTIAVPIIAGGQRGWILAEISLEQLWRTVDGIRVGTEGYALLLDERGKVIAHGNPDDKRLIATAAPGTDAQLQLAGARRAQVTAAERSSARYADPRGREVLAVAAFVGNPAWTLIIEQPTSDAFRVAHELRVQLLVAIALALLGTVVVGWLWGRSFISRIFALTHATRALADGRMDERVLDRGRDEIRELGDAFNSMADRLVQLQEDVRKQERQAMFGRIAAGLVHDLSNPVQNLVNSGKLVLKLHDDAEYREEFRKIVEREGTLMKRVLDDLRNIARPMPLDRVPLEVNRTAGEAVEALSQAAEMAGVTLRLDAAQPGAVIEGDSFALGRVYRNLILNAIQATAPGGSIVVTTEVRGARVQVRIYDTGCGIAPERLPLIFDDFVTTKRRGLGLGLAISKKIVEQLGGKISVASEVGRGTTFVIDFPVIERPAIAAVS